MAVQRKIPVSFKESEKELYEQMKSMGCFSYYVKNLIKEDLKNKEEPLNKKRKKFSF